MFKRLMAVMLMAVLIVAVASVGGVARADEPTPVPANTPEGDLADARQQTYENGSYGGGPDGNSDGLMYMVSDTSAAETADDAGTAMNIQPNPWGCRIRADNPHEPHDSPGPGNIRGKAAINCTTLPPSHVATIWQELSRWEGSDYAIQEVNYSVCPSGQGDPDCYPTRLRNGVLMRGYVVTSCEIGTTYVWVQLAEATLTVEGVTYSGLSGNSETVECTEPED